MNNLPLLSPAQSLLSALTKAIEAPLQTGIFLSETKDLLVAIREQLLWYRKALAAFREAGLAEEYVALSKQVREDFLSRNARLVEDIKGLCEGTTDSIPYEFAIYLNHEYGRLCGKEGGVALCPYRQFNFVYHDVGRSLRATFDKLSETIIEQRDNQEAKLTGLEDPPALPSSLVMIGYQYAMSDDIVYQSMLFHELGHHLFPPSCLNTPDYTRKMMGALKTRPSIQKELSKRPQGMSESDAWRFLDDYIRPLCSSWVNELFCDAFAMAMAGPQFGLTFDDLVGWQPRQTSFGNSHPANLLRRHVQWRVLQQTGWLSSPTPDGADGSDAFTKMALQSFGSLKPTQSLAGVSWQALPAREPYADVLGDMADWLVDQIDVIAEEGINVARDASSRSAEFWSLGPHVARLLNRAVVPSTVITSDDLGIVAAHQHEGKCWRYYPQPCTVMNVARLLHETGCEDLLGLWPDNGNGRKDRFSVGKRLSEWTQKAIEDWLLLQGMGGLHDSQQAHNPEETSEAGR